MVKAEWYNPNDRQLTSNKKSLLENVGFSSSEDEHEIDFSDESINKPKLGFDSGYNE
jgi:hypothetical protein